MRRVLRRTFSSVIPLSKIAFSHSLCFYSGGVDSSALDEESIVVSKHVLAEHVAIVCGVLKCIQVVLLSVGMYFYSFVTETRRKRRGVGHERKRAKEGFDIVFQVHLCRLLCT